ncbi:DUF2935 domain-containing protein [Ornithinibacillus halophilus]|nr:DUF2935 domain-containing protein [Ornithinibacillus halophilus]
MLAEASFEHQYWLKIMKDHAQFIRNSLHLSETKNVETTEELIKVFDHLLAKSKSLSNTNVIAFTKEAESAIEVLKKIKLSLLKHQLKEGKTIHLSPTTMNHMVNELEEYEVVINYLKEGMAPATFHELHHHLIWLSDAANHANTIHVKLDKTEISLKKKSNEFKKQFEAYYLNAVEFTGYLRSNLSSYPALKRFNEDVMYQMKLFQTFLFELDKMDLALLGTISPLMVDHMYREHCYYLIKLSHSTKTQPPACDPTIPDTLKKEPWQ